MSPAAGALRVFFRTSRLVSDESAIASVLFDSVIAKRTIREVMGSQASTSGATNAPLEAGARALPPKASGLPAGNQLVQMGSYRRLEAFRIKVLHVGGKLIELVERFDKNVGE